MKIKGIKLTYYMKNGSEIVDESFEFLEPVEEQDKDLKDLAEQVKKSVKEAVRSENGGCIAYGNLYVNTKEVNAIRFEMIKDGV